MPHNIPSARQQQLATAYLSLLDQHLAELKSGQAEQVFTIAEFAAQLFVHPIHLSNTIKTVTGFSTCDLFEDKLLRIAKELLLETNQSIAAIARQLHYDPSNFNKFFKSYEGVTPGTFRKAAATNFSAARKVS
jgi:AraC family transcriptional regulator, regulatory protein of adaptative response / methylphosphotriester-DNA alkyltransferase methyltransferase